MRERPFYFVVVLFLFFNVEIFSQKNAAGIKFPAIITKLSEFESAKNLHYFSIDPISHGGKINFSPAITKTQKKLFVISSSFYCNHLTFFCNKELQLEKMTSVPLRFRLGSLDYVNYLEQKPNASKTFVH